MKTILITFSLTLLFAFTTNAQSRLSEGNTFIGGAFQVGSTTLGNVGGFGNVNSFNYQVAPTLGYFMSDKIVVGGTLGMSGYQVADEMRNSLIISPFVRNYFITNEHMGLYGAASLPVTLINNDRAGLSFSAGVTFFATEKIALEARTSLLSISAPFDGGDINYRIGLNTNSVGLGFLIFL